MTAPVGLSCAGGAVTGGVPAIGLR
jgi:hypothetical protein